MKNKKKTSCSESESEVIESEPSESEMAEESSEMDQSILEEKEVSPEKKLSKEFAKLKSALQSAEK